MYVYALSFPKDRNYLKALVGGVFILDLLQTAFATHYAWYVLAAEQGDTTAIAAIPPLSGLVAFIVQSFFVWRIWKLAAMQKIIHCTVMGLIMIAAVVSLVGSWWAGILSSHFPDNSAASAAKLDKPVTLWLSASVTCDVMITATIVVQLLRCRSEDIFSYKTNQMIHRAIRMTIETGALTAAVAITDLVLYLNADANAWYFMFGLLIGKIYSNSLLASLNSRAPIFQIESADVVTSGGSIWNSNQRSTIEVNESHVKFRRLNGGGHGTSFVDTRVGNDVCINTAKSSKTEGINEC